MRQIQQRLLFACVTFFFCAPIAHAEPIKKVPFQNTRFAEENTKQPVTQKPIPASRRITPPSDGVKLGKPQAGSEKKKASGVGSIWTTLGSLALIVGLILLAARLFKKGGGISSGGLPREAMELLGRQPIDARQSIHLIRLGSRILVVGSSPDGMQTLTEVTDPVEVDYLAGVCKTNTEKSPFTNAFRTFFTHTNDDNHPAQSSSQRETSAVEIPTDQEFVNQFAGRTRQNRSPQTHSLRESPTGENLPHG